MDIELIRKLFSMAQITMSGNRITLTYDYMPELYFTQPVCRDQMSALVGLLKTLNAIQIERINNNKTKIVLILPDQFDFQPTIMPPLERLRSYEEIVEKMYQDSSAKGVTDEERVRNARLVTSFVHDWKDENEFFEQLQSLFAYMSELHKTDRPIDLQSHAKYPEFKNAGIKLLKYCKNIEFDAPFEDVSGEIKITFSAVQDIFIDGDFLKALCDLFELTMEFDISGDLGFKEIDAMFYL